MDIGLYPEMVSAEYGASVACDERGEYGAAESEARIQERERLRKESERIAAKRDAKQREEDLKRGAAGVRFEMTDGLLPVQVDREIKRGRRAGDIGHRIVAFYLADCADRGLHQAFGHASVVPYAVRRHGISRRCARDLIVAGRALRELKKIDAEFLAGGLFWSQVRAMAKVAEVSTEDSWIAFAKAHTIDELEREAARAKKGERPREDGKGTPTTKFNLSLKVSALLQEQYALARQKMSAEAGHFLSDEEFAGGMLEAVLRRTGEAESADSLYRVAVDIAPGGDASIRSEDGPIPIDAATAAAICCDAGVLGPDGQRVPGKAPPIPDGLRRKILARDGYRCLICGSRYRLQVHHIVFRNDHGSNAWMNLMTTCAHHHALIHDGFLSVTGAAPRGLVFRDRNGDILSDPAKAVDVGAVTAVRIEPAGAPSDAPASGPRGPLNSGSCAEKLALAQPTLPAEVDPLWLNRHRHLLSWDATRTALRMGEGTALPPEAVTAAPEAPPASPVSLNPLRPATLDDVVGQPGAVGWLRIAARAALRTGRMPTPLLLLGSGGLGKSTLAGAFAQALGSRLKMIDCSTLDDPMTLIGHLFDLRDRDVLFFDEIHALPPKLGEALYQAVEDGVIQLPFAEGIQTKTVRLRLPKVAFVGATTNPERMPAPFLSRFRVLQLSPYGLEDLAEIVRRAAARDGVDVAEDARAVIAGASSGVARVAIELYTGTRTLVEATWAGVTVEAFRRLYEPALMMSGAIIATPRGIALG